MPKREIEPLEPSMWFAEIEKLYTRRLACGDEAPSSVFRKAFYLVQLAPKPLEPFLPTDLEEAVIEARLESGAYVDVALALFCRRVGLTLAKDSADIMTNATITIPGAACVGRDADEEPAKAILGAWCQAFMALQQPNAEQVWRGDTRLTVAHELNAGLSIH